MVKPIAAPSPDVLHWISDAVGPGTTIQSVCPLSGATSSTLHSIQVIYKRRNIKLVLRRFTKKEWLREEPDEYNPFWDLMTIIEVLPGPPGVYAPWIEFGVRHLNAQMLRERVDEYLVSVMTK